MRRAGEITVLLALGALGCGDGEQRTVASAVLVTLDTTRADAVHFGELDGPTPALAALARESVVYEQARTVAPLTLPAHASMMTGLYPPRHGVRDNGRGPLPASASTLAERARDEGRETAAFVAAVVLDSTFGLDQGFDVYDVPAHDGRPGPAATTAAVSRRSGEAVVEAAIAWLEGRDADRPFFLWVHLFDPHAPYAPPADLLERAGGHPYLGEVAAADRAVGQLLEALGPHLDGALVVVAGDHGEALGEHDEPTHSSLCYEATLRVPFLVRHPDGARAGEVSQEVVTVADVEATIADALGLPPSSGGDGQSLFRSRVKDDRGVYFESYYGFLNYGWSPLAGWADAGGKYLHGSTPELYDTRVDPEESKNLAPGRPERVARYRDELERAISGPALAADAQGAGSTNAALLDALRGLGYAAVPRSSPVPHPLEETGLPGAFEQRAELRSYYTALWLAEHGRFDEAIDQLAEVTSANPRHWIALDFQSAWLVARGRCAEAQPLLERLAASESASATSLNNLATCLERAGDREAALAYYLRAVAVDPHHVSALRNLLRILDESGDPDAAADVRTLLHGLTGDD